MNDLIAGTRVEGELTLDGENIYAAGLDVVELLMSLEDNFNITVPDEIANELVTVEAIVKYIESQVK